MKRFKKILLWVGLPLLLLVIIAAVILGNLVKSFVDPDSVVARIEAERNCRVQLGSIDAELFGGKVVLHDLVLLPRDEAADAGTPLADRAPPEGGQTAIRVKRLALDAKLTDLFAKKVTVSKLVVEGLDVSFLIERDGTASLDPLFDPPQTVKGGVNENFEEESRRRELAKARRKQKPDAEEPIEIDTFNIEELPIPASVKRLEIKDAVVNIKLRKDKTRIQVSGLDVLLDDLDIDPKDLAGHNSAHLVIEGKLDIKDKDKTTTYADLDLRAEGDIVPFDAVTGYLNPDIVTEVTLKKGSEIYSLPLIEKLASTLDKLKKAGLDLKLDDLMKETLVIDEDASTRLGWRDGIVRTAAPLAVGLNGHLLLMEPGAWLHTGSNEHEIKGDLTFSESISGSAFGGANAFLVGIVGEELAKSVGELLFTPVTKNGRVYVPFVSTGDFGRPKVRPRVDLLDLSDVLQSEAKDDALNLLKGLLERN